jgi:hypothetical protein
MTPEQKAIEAVESCRDIADKHGDSEFYGQFVTRLNEALPVLRKMVEEKNEKADLYIFDPLLKRKVWYRIDTHAPALLKHFEHTVEAATASFHKYYIEGLKRELQRAAEWKKKVLEEVPHHIIPADIDSHQASDGEMINHRASHTGKGRR